MSARKVDRAVAEMRARDPERALVAAAVIEALIAGERLDTLSLGEVQRFAWYGVTTGWLGSVDAADDILDAVAELFDRVDLPRYAEVCRSEATASILAAFARSPQDGMRAYHQAYLRSGIRPVDLDDFTWSRAMLDEERAAYLATERALERAIDEGRFTPGRRGWRTAAAAVTTETLDGPHPDIPGQTLRTAVLTERLGDWVRSAEVQSPGLHRLRSRHANTLIPPVAAPADAAEHMGPVLWFLGRVEGARLTQAGYLPTDMVREASERFGWTVEPFGTPPRSESELGALFEIHEMLRRSGAVYRRHGRVHVSRSGASLGDDPEAAWRWTAAHMLTHPWEFAVTEVMTLQLLDGAVDERAAIGQATRILGATWRVGDRRPDRTGVYHGFAPAQRMLRTLDGLEERGEWPERVLELNGFGRATLLEHLRSKATGPAAPTA